LVTDGKITKIGASLPDVAEKTIDAKGGFVTPAFVDPHTHALPPNDRSNEFALRSVKSYEDIAKEGGGILSSVKACKEATVDQIFDANEKSLKRFIHHGTLTLEIKSGYGLDLDTEIKILQAIKKLKLKYR
jgi:imidazolonepropionase